MRKAGAYAALPFATIPDTVVAPFQLTGDAGVWLIHLGDNHSRQVYEANKNSVTLPLDEVTSLVFYIPGYLLFPFDTITPDDYYPLTGNCLDVINKKPENPLLEKQTIRRTRKLPKDDFEDW